MSVGISWASHNSLIYTSELILCSTIRVHSATRQNIHMYPHLNSGVRLLLELYGVVVIKHVAFFSIWVKFWMPFNVPIYLWTFTPLFSEVVVVSDLNKNFVRSTNLAKRHRSADWHIPIHPPPGDDQHFEYDDDSDNGSDGFVVEVPFVLCRARNSVSS